MPKIKRDRATTAASNNKTAVSKLAKVKTEQGAVSNPDYEAIIESLALYEPEQAMFRRESVDISGEHQIEGDMTAVTMDEEMITNAVTVAVNNLKDSSQIFGDFVADRLRKLSDKTSEYCKEKIMQIILEAGTFERTIVNESE